VRPPLPPFTSPSHSHSPSSLLSSAFANKNPRLGTFPCGGQDTVSSNRTSWPLSGGSIALEMGHIDANVEVLIAIGSNPGSAFNTVLRPTFSEQGLGAFCMTGFRIPSSLNVADGTQATIQVVRLSFFLPFPRSYFWS
jgi:hypothetical protein